MARRSSPSRPSWKRVFTQSLAGLAFGLLVSLPQSCGTPAPTCSASTCAGCCDSGGVCRTSNTVAACGTSGTCKVCSTGQSCTGGSCIGGTGGGSGSGGGAGGTGGAGGGGSSQTVYVTFRYDYEKHLGGTCPNFNVQQTTCSVLKTMALSRFQTLRVEYPSCTTTQTTTDGYTIDCTGDCYTQGQVCFDGTNQVNYQQLVCPAPAHATSTYCSWTPP